MGRLLRNHAQQATHARWDLLALHCALLGTHAVSRMECLHCVPLGMPVLLGHLFQCHVKGVRTALKDRHFRRHVLLGPTQTQLQAWDVEYLS